MNNINLATAMARGKTAWLYFNRAACAACADVAQMDAPTRRGYLNHLAVEKTAEDAALALGGNVRQQRAVRTAHRRLARACAVEIAAFRAAI